jgi:putative endonuclease
MNRNQRVGQWGELAAADYLVERGYEILQRNLRTPYGEIDLLVRKEGFTVFVEVKSRTSATLGPPEIAVTRAKLTHMVACAEHYAQQNGLDHWQIDVIAVLRVAGKARITHFENAA